MNPFIDVRLNHDLPVYQQLCLHIKRKILRGEYTNYQELPSRREVAAQLSINPNTVQKAYRTMEEEGYLKTIANVKSVIIVNDGLIEKIRRELVDQMLHDFVIQCLETGIDRETLIAMLNEHWHS